MSFSSAIKKFSSLKKPGRAKDLTQGFQVPGNRHSRSEIEKAPQAGLFGSPPVGGILNFNFLNYGNYKIGSAKNLTSPKTLQRQVSPTSP